MTETLHIRRATPRPETLDREARTVEAVIATTNPVPSRDRRGPVLEVLDPAGFDAADAAGLPVLDNHRKVSVRDTIGTVASARWDGTELVGLLRLSAADDVGPILTRIEDGTLRGVSAGFTVRRWAERTEGDQRIKTAVAWVLREVTLTTTPADPAATIRSSSKEKTMNDTTTTTPAPDEAERQRRQDIRALVRSAGLPGETADDMIDRGADLTEAKAAVYDEMRSRSRPTIRVHGESGEDPTVIRRRQADALSARMAGTAPPDDAKEFTALGLRDLARECVERAGTSTRMMGDDERIRAALTTSDFPEVVSNAMNKVAAQAYEIAQSPLKQVARQRNLSDFKEAKTVRLGNAGQLQELSEDGEITHTSRAEAAEAMSLRTYARQITVSRALMVNDDLGLMGDMTAEFGRAAAQTEAALLAAQITDNLNMADGTPVFDSGRGNVEGSNTALEVAGLTTARQAMRGRTALDGATPIAAVPRYVLVAPDLETQAEQVLAQIQPTTADDVNPFGGRLELLVEPRLPSGAWYVFADPARLPSLQYAYLASAPGVQIQRAESWDTLGLKFRAWLDFGAGWVDWRGVHKLPVA
ncbi:prohead protease/major capsid protein fusion protein [Roseovarius salinarum]|uniref:prohead protease/major capsid protein fusion protein n=1 Tax=Roseovarius salinarum TaxID=1981892 RepID=UPI0018E4276F|nr:prohead protease/major capsid protein fusion protein [Roseovarius salinarum]